LQLIPSASEGWQRENLRSGQSSGQLSAGDPHRKTQFRQFLRYLRELCVDGMCFCRIAVFACSVGSIEKWQSPMTFSTCSAVPMNSQLGNSNLQHRRYPWTGKENWEWKEMIANSNPLCSPLFPLEPRASAPLQCLIAPVND